LYSLILKDSDADVIHFGSLVSGLSLPSLFEKNNTVFWKLHILPSSGWGGTY